MCDYQISYFYHDNILILVQDPEAQMDENKDPGWEDLGQQKIYTDEELRQFEEKYAKVQGWGEHAYDGAQTLAPHPSTPPQAKGTNGVADSPPQP